MDYEPGPIPPSEPPDPGPLGPSGGFTSIGAVLSEFLDGADGALASIVGVVAEPLPVDLEGEFNSTIAVAEDVLATQPPESTFSPSGPVHDAGDSVEALRLEVRPNLPPVETPIQIDVDAPPELPAAVSNPPPPPGIDPSTGCPIGWNYDPFTHDCTDPTDPTIHLPSIYYGG